MNPRLFSGDDEGGVKIPPKPVKRTHADGPNRGGCSILP